MSGLTNKNWNRLNLQGERSSNNIEIEEDEDEDLAENSYDTPKDALLFAIEVRDSMLFPHSGGEIPVATAIKCVYQIMQQRIISSPKDTMGVILFGTEKSKFNVENSGKNNGLKYPHYYLLMDLNIPSSDDVKLLRSIAHSDEAKEILVPSKEIVSISNLFFCANQLFAEKAQRFSSRRLFIITDNDSPHYNDKNIKNQAIVRARDLIDSGVTVELFPISQPGQDFKRSNFYDEVVVPDDPNEEETFLISKSKLEGKEDGIFNLTSLVSDVNSKLVSKRALFSGLSFEIGPNFRISVNGYNLIQRQKPSRSCWIYDGGEQLQVATAECCIITEGTSMEVQKSDIKKAYRFGGSQICFTPEEHKAMKYFESPVLRIIGFKPKSMLPLWAAVDKSTFIYPSEEQFVGSTRVFSALWRKLLDDKRIGIAWYIPRLNASPTLVGILPSHEQPGTPHVKNLPAGLWLNTLPFADDLRNLPPIPTPVSAPDILIDQMRTVIQQLQLPGGSYDPSKYPNPALQWHYRILQAIALDDDVRDIEKEDKTLPRFRQINKRAGPYIKEWCTTLEKQIRLYQKSKYGGM